MTDLHSRALRSTLALLLLLPACAHQPVPVPAAVPIATPALRTVEAARAVTADIARGIERHIARESEAQQGFFRLPFEQRELRLKLVRVHLEYLASLGSLKNFACVDLVDTDGEVYDVDFFMDGPPDDMVVTETTVHKINGKPLYAWEQAKDETWHRVPMDQASAKLKDVIEGRDTFEFVYRVELPKLAAPARLWVPVPISDRSQRVVTRAITAPGRQRELEDRLNANRVLLLELEPADGEGVVELRFGVERFEKPPYAEPLPDPARYLQPDRLAPLTADIQRTAREVVVGKATDLIKARALYDHVMDRMSYKRVGEGWGQGDLVYACDTRSGNCSDYHTYFIALARAAGLPARFAVGATIPAARDAGGISSYHCWAEFYADGKWWPVDISEADKYSNLSTYYFGHHPANRIELSRGRDLVLDPGPASGPINFLAHPMLEVGGKPVRLLGKFSFTRELPPVASGNAGR
ncbi:MAG: transglutaminase-like domain-containing protein [Myxococcales bacterium]|nr:transglutaminase-like domain-containing protein [Myxococcales bacterium]